MNGQQMLTRLNGVEGYIRGTARRYSNGDPMLAEDLAQEAREAAIKRLQEAPDCPESHLVVKARDAIYKYRARGSSVDGKLDQRDRERRYPTLHLQAPIGRGGDLTEEVIGDPSSGRRPTEVHALAITLLGRFRACLSAGEEQVLTLRLTEISWDEIGEALGQDERGMYQHRAALEQKALTIWQPPNGNGHTPHRIKRRYTRTPAVPDELPPALLDVLSDKERIALAACREGASQTEAARVAGMSQPTVSRLIRFVWENHDKPAAEIAPRTTRYRNDDRREQVLGLFYSRPVGELVTYAELLALFSDVTVPRRTMWKTLSRYSKQLEGERIILVKGEGYRMIEEGPTMTDDVQRAKLAPDQPKVGKKRKLRDGGISELTHSGD